MQLTLVVPGIAAAAAKINAQLQAKKGIQHVDVPPIRSVIIPDYGMDLEPKLTHIFRLIAPGRIRTQMASPTRKSMLRTETTSKILRSTICATDTP